MEANEILQSDLLDIIFEGKNKLYGAYDMRKTYSRRLKKAITITFSLITLTIAGTVVAGKLKNNSAVLLKVKEIEIGKIDENIPPPPPLPPPPPPPALLPPPPLNQARFIPPTIVKDDLVAPDEKITELTDDQQISNITLKSDNLVKIIQAPTREIGTDVVELPKAKDNGPVIFEIVEIEAKFPGGPDAWRKYLSNKLDPYTPINDGAPEGTYTVIVRFVVSQDGIISNIVAETKLGYGMEQEAIKVIKNGPKWIPAQQNGRFVNAYRRQPITFIVQ